MRLLCVIYAMALLLASESHKVEVHSSVSPTVTFIDLFTPTQGGPYACYRVPGVARSPTTGHILVFVEARIPSCDDQAPKDVLLTVSQDDGATWSPPTRVLGDHTGNLTFRNPTPVFDANGTVVLQAVNSTLEDWVSLQLTSNDEGVTWSSPVSVSSELGSWNGALAGPGNALLLGTASPSSQFKGRMVYCGTTGYQPGRPFAAAVWYSDSAGSSWTVSSSSEDEFKGMAECAMAELPNASLLINFRANHENPCDCRAQSRSDDGGSTWTPLQWVPALVEPVCSAGLQGTRGGAVYFSNPATASTRTNMTVRMSEDGGLTWPAQHTSVVWPFAAAYSALVPLSHTDSGGAVGIVFERGQTSYVEHVSFAAVTVP
jgi:sialidase-1